MLAILALFLTLFGACAMPAQERHLLFDDFTYANAEQLAKRGWIVRTAPGWPGVPGAKWGSVSFPEKGILEMTASTDGTAAGTRQVQVCHERKYREGTYAARVYFTDEATKGKSGDQVVETFYMITPLREPMALEYSEIDFEYLPKGGWGKVGPTFFGTTWETFSPEPNWKADNVHEAKSRSYAGWHTLVVQVASGKVRYFVDGALFAEHSGEVYPESLMSINFNLWYIRNGLTAPGPPREHLQRVDWVFHEAGVVLTPAEVEATVAAFRKRSISFRDTVPRPDPPLESPCNL